MKQALGQWYAEFAQHHTASRFLPYTTPEISTEGATHRRVPFRDGAVELHVRQVIQAAVERSNAPNLLPPQRQRILQQYLPATASNGQEILFVPIHREER